MKIAIMTQPLGKNYGGIMQAYALQKVLRDLGNDVVTIDRQHDERSLFKKLLLPFKPIIFKLLRRDIMMELSSENSEYIYSSMTNFIKNNIHLSEPIYSSVSLKDHSKKSDYDLIVVGSDQVWRPRYSPNLYNFFVDFIEEDVKSIAYAASFGVDKWEFNKKQSKNCKLLAKKFAAISVRESSGVALCREHLNITPEVVLDPTLLISAYEYEKLLSGYKSKKKGGVLKYILDDSDQKKGIINQVAAYINKPIITAQPTKKLSDYSDDIEDYRYPPVEEWLMSFRDCDFVVTDSFHGCVFSIIFNKPFIAIGNYKRGLSRFESLLMNFELRDRLIIDKDTNIKQLLKKEINWKKVNSILTKHQESSIDFLKKWV